MLYQDDLAKIQTMVDEAVSKISAKSTSRDELKIIEKVVARVREEFDSKFSELESKIPVQFETGAEDKESSKTSKKKV